MSKALQDSAPDRPVPVERTVSRCAALGTQAALSPVVDEGEVRVRDESFLLSGDTPAKVQAPPLGSVVARGSPAPVGAKVTPPFLWQGHCSRLRADPHSLRQCRGQ